MKKLRFILLLAILPFSGLFAQTFSWVQKAAFPGTARSAAVAFTINNKAFIVTGVTTAGADLKQLWRWNQTNNTWTQRANLPGPARRHAVAFSIGTIGYVAMGLNGSNTQLKDIWAFDESTNTWAQKSTGSLPTRYLASCFVIGGNAFIGLGSPKLNDLWQYNAASDSWTQKANLPASFRQGAASFTIGNFGYIACGSSNGIALSELWQYNSTTNVWAQKASFPGTARHNAASFVVNGKGFVGTGGNLGVGFYSDFFSYDPALDSWSYVSPLPSNARKNASSFSLNGKGYISCGLVTGGNSLNDLWEYGPVSITVTLTVTNVKCNGGTDGKITSSAAGVAPYTYLWNTGSTTANLSNISAGTYTVTITDVTGTSGTASAIVTQPTPITLVSQQTFTVCSGQSITLVGSASGGTSPYTYSWNNGAFIGKNYTVTPSVSSTYTLKVTDAKNCVSPTQLNVVNVVSIPTAPINTNGTVLTCGIDSVKISTRPGVGLSYQWKKNGTNILNAIDSFYYAKTAGTYKVVVTKANGCSVTSIGTSVTTQTLTPIVSPSGTVSICAGAKIDLIASPGTGYAYKWLKNGNAISGAKLPTYIASAAGTYKVVLTGASGCSATSAGTVVIVNCKTESGNDLATIFPNPSGTIFNFDLTRMSSIESITVAIHDISGRLISRFENLSNNDKYSTGDDLLPGVYFAKIQQGSETKIYRIIKTE